MSFTLDFDSVARVCGKTDQLMVYGFTECRYGEVQSFLKKDAATPIKLVLTWQEGMSWDVCDSRTLEGRKFNLLKWPANTKPTHILIHQCKFATTNLVLENYRRRNEGKPIIPCIFIADCDDGYGPKPADLPKLITTKIDKENSKVRWTELRRIYKLCRDQKLTQKLRDVAQATFLFIRLVEESENTYAFKRIDAPWEGAREIEFAEAWKQRKLVSKSAPKPSDVNWRAQLIAHAATIDQNRMTLPQIIKAMEEIDTKISLAMQKPKGDLQEHRCIVDLLRKVLQALKDAKVRSPRFLRKLQLLVHRLQCLKSRDGL